MRRIIEIRSAEGGQDSQIFVGELANAYERLARNQGWTCT
jgi:protein subunit release factor A